MKVFNKTFKFGGQEVTIETGRIAQHADASVVVKSGDTMVMVTAVAAKEAREGADFFPLTVNYQEKFYAAGRVPGGFLKREGRSTERETLISRLIDRPLRPLFPEGFYNEVNVIAQVVSLDPEVPSDILALIGASAAVTLAGLPFAGPIGAARVGYKDGEYLLNPSDAQTKESMLDLVVAGTSDAVLMVESEADCLPEDVMLGAVLYGHEQMQAAIQAINELAEKAAKPAMEWTAPEENKALTEAVKKASWDSIVSAYKIKEKADRYAKLKEARAALTEALLTEEEGGYTEKELLDTFHQLEKDHVRQTIISGEHRIDGRDTRTVRPISTEVGYLPRAHGSALFTRGETQALVVATLGSDRDAQLMDNIVGEDKNRFMLHYNFPPYSVGEVGMMMGPKRREIGHGNLARRAINAVLPEECPYVLRVVSEITASNGSSSMATVCGTSMSLMDAGVNLKAPVAGIAMGLIKEGDKFAVLTDILGDEDHLGDMDFKVAGTEEGVTALQMDIKITGITRDIMSAALSQAKEGRLHILKIMNDTLSTGRDTVAKYAPRISVMKIDPAKVRDVIGKGGATIRSITEETGVDIDLTDDGEVKIFAPDQEAAEAATKRVELVTAEAEIGKVYQGKVVRLADYGAFVNILPGKDGLVHVSQISEERVEDVSAVLSEGQEIDVKVLDIDRQGRIKLSMKEVAEKKDAEAPKAEATDEAAS